MVYLEMDLGDGLFVSNEDVAEASIGGGVEFHGDGAGQI